MITPQKQHPTLTFPDPPRKVSLRPDFIIGPNSDFFLRACWLPVVLILADIFLVISILGLVPQVPLTREFQWRGLLICSILLVAVTLFQIWRCGEMIQSFQRSRWLLQYGQVTHGVFLGAHEMGYDVTSSDSYSSKFIRKTYADYSFRDHLGRERRGAFCL